MASLGEWLAGVFGFLGPAGTLLALFLVFVLDAAIVPTLPEIFFVLSYAYRPPGWDADLWVALLLGMALAGEAVGNTIMYAWVRGLLVDRGRMPRSIEKAMQKWTRFLLVRDERIILLNRLAPVIPFTGAFIAVLRWSYRRSLAYILLGAAAKYGFLLALVAYLGYTYNRDTASLITVVAVFVILALSLAASVLYRRRIGPEVPPP